MNRFRIAAVTALLLTALIATFTGCSSAPPAGQSGVRVLAVAEPKAGYVQPPAGTPGYSVGPEGAESHAFG